jgi:hypothetical protein
MNKAIVSFAHGDKFVDLLKVAIPRFYKYSTIHNYDLIIPSYNNVVNICRQYKWDHNRPTSWLKVPIIKHVLQSGFDIVQWIDCDVIINKLDIDINTEFQDTHHNQSFVVHHDLYEGEVPNAGIWGFKQSAISLLDDIWNQEDCINHKWWEQGANIKLITSNKEYLDKCYTLPYAFNVHKNDIRFKYKDWEKEGIMLHATMWPDRLSKMKEWASNE